MSQVKSLQEDKGKGFNANKFMFSKTHKLPKMFGRIMSSKGTWTEVKTLK